MLYKKGVSSNYNEPMKYDQIKRMPEQKIRDVYNAIISTNNLVNVQTTKGADLGIVDTDKYEYILTYSFPCQDLSLAGKRAGMNRDENTRSGMLWEVERILKECYELNQLPQVLLMENVPQVCGAGNEENFVEWQQELEKLGYKSYFEILNAKDYGIPQNRERCFMVSILGNYSYSFPKKIPLKLKLKDMLEDNVDEKYYLSDKMINFFYENEKKQKEKGNGFKFGVTDGSCIAKTITTRIDASKNSFLAIKDKINIIGNYSPSNHNASRVVDTNGIAPTVMGNHNTVTAVVNNLRIRKLTPKECYRLMGFDDEDYENAKRVTSDSMIYHTAGDSITVNTLMAIFSQLLENERWEDKWNTHINKNILKTEE